MNEALNLNNWRDESEAARRSRDWWWAILKTLRRKHGWRPVFGGDGSGRGWSDEFNDWLAEEHGIQMTFTSEGMISERFEIVDEAKYLVFLLKYA